MSAKALRALLLLPIFGLCACEKKEVSQDGSKRSVKMTVSQAVDLIDELTDQTISDNKPSDDVEGKRLISVNTYTHQLESQSIEDLYYHACKKLSEIYGDKLETYRYSDQMGYPGQVTIVEFDDEVRGPFYIVAGVFEANDNDSFWLYCVNGLYDREKDEKRPNWELDSVLRCNWTDTE